MTSQAGQEISRPQRPHRGRDGGPVRGNRPRGLHRAGIGLILAALALAALGTWVIRRVTRPGPDALWAQAQADLRAGRFEQAERAVARLDRLRRPTPLDRMLRGQLAVALKQADRAIAELSLVPDGHFMAAQARLLAGQVELRRDRLRFGEEWLRAAVRLDPKLIQAHRELIYIYGLQLRRAELHAEFLALASLTPLTFEEAFHWCLLRNESWEPIEAARMLLSCVAADPGDRASRLALAENQRRMGQLDEAESALAPLAPDDPEAIAARARLAFDRQEPERAERLLAAGPRGDPGLARLRGRLALARRDARAAADHFRIAYAADPDSREALFGLIGALQMLGQAKAVAPLRQLAAHREYLQGLVQRAGSAEARGDPELPRRLGEACAALHRDVEARAWYQVAIARDPLDSRAQRALYRLGAAGDDGPHPARSGP
jgi:predicted Zn-dependent protease